MGCISLSSVRLRYRSSSSVSVGECHVEVESCGLRLGESRRGRIRCFATAKKDDRKGWDRRKNMKAFQYLVVGL